VQPSVQPLIQPSVQPTTQEPVTPQIQNLPIKKLKKRKNVSFPALEASTIPIAEPEIMNESNENLPIVAATSSVLIANNYYNIYGIEFAKSTLYISVIFLLLLCIYFIYVYFRRPTLQIQTANLALDKTNKSIKREEDVTEIKPLPSKDNINI
jgi:hypothetical protein